MPTFRDIGLVSRIPVFPLIRCVVLGHVAPGNHDAIETDLHTNGFLLYILSGKLGMNLERALTLHFDVSSSLLRGVVGFCVDVLAEWSSADNDLDFDTRLTREYGHIYSGGLWN